MGKVRILYYFAVSFLDVLSLVNVVVFLTLSLIEGVVVLRA